MKIIFLLIMVLSTILNITAAYAQDTLFFENFNYPDGSLPKPFWAEGTEAVGIREEHLWSDANKDGNGETTHTSSVWLNKWFEGENIQVEFDTHVLHSINDKNNINFFFLYSDPSGKSLKKTRKARVSADYKLYHQLNGYIFTYLANGQPDSARFRFRDNPGFNLIGENYTYECKQGKTYHIKITKNQNHFTYAVDGKIYLDFKDDKFNETHQSGFIGFRTWNTEMWWDNFLVTKPEKLK